MALIKMYLCLEEECAKVVMFAKIWSNTGCIDGEAVRLDDCNRSYS